MSPPQAEQSRATSAERTASTFRVTLLLFVASGAAGLIDQICFSKYLAYIVGSTAYAISAVLAAFMVGLALGAHLAGGAAVRVRRPLLAYGVLEIVVALAVSVAPAAFSALTPLYVSLARSSPDSLATLTALRWSLASVIVIVPTMAMGATLPLLSKLVALDDDASGRVREGRLGALYAANTLGGAVGALSAAYVILPALGLSKTLYAGAAASALVGVVAIAVGRTAVVRVDAPPARTVEAPPTAPADWAGKAWLLAVLALLSGFLVFACEVVFTHLLALIIGNSVYAFGLILAVFLSCLFVGATRAPALHARLGSAALPLGLAATGVALLATMPLWDMLPLLFGSLRGVKSFAGREAVRALAAFAILVVPTTLMGLTFPLLLQRIATRADVAARVGRLTAINTLGAVAGSIVTGYVLLPALGSERTLVVVGVVYTAAALLALTGVVALWRRWTLSLGAASLAGAVLVPPWNLARLTSGTNVYFERYDPPDAILFTREDVHGGVTTVVVEEGVRVLLTNGKFQGNDGHEMEAQRFFAHYPSLFVHRFDRALVIGVGTATTLGTLAAYPWKAIEVVDISPSIVEAADRFFQSVNRNALHDPRVRLHIDDGRNHVRVSTERYDLVSMELSSIWFAGAASLYSREFYESIDAHLQDGGVFQQWVQFHHIRPHAFATVVNTLRAVFPHVVLFYGGKQGILVASRSPLVASRRALASYQGDPTLSAVIPGARPLPTLLDDVLVTGPSLDAFLDAAARDAGVERERLVSTDDNLFLEYETPRGNVLPWKTREATAERVMTFRRAEDVAALLGP